MVTFIVWVLFGALTAVIAYNKHRNPWGWGAIGVLMGFFGVIVIWMMPKPGEKINNTALAVIVIAAVIWSGVFMAGFVKGFIEGLNGASPVSTSAQTEECVHFVSYDLTVQMGELEAQHKKFDQAIPIDVYNDRVYVHSEEPQRYTLQRKLLTETDHVLYSATDAHGREVGLSVWYPKFTGNKEFLLIITGVEGKNMKVGYRMSKAE